MSLTYNTFRSKIFSTIVTASCIASLSHAQSRLLVSDLSGGNVASFSYPDGKESTLFVASGSTPLGLSSGMVQMPSGDVLILSHNDRSVLRYNGQSGDYMGYFVLPAPGGSDEADLMSYGPDGHLYVTSHANDNVLKFDGDTGSSLGVAANNVDAIDIAFGPTGTLFVSDYAGNRIAMYDPTDGNHLGDITATSATPIMGAYGLATDSSGNLYLSSDLTNSIVRIDIATLSTSVFVSPGDGGLSRPRDIIFDDEGNLLVASSGSESVLRYDMLGNFMDVLISPDASAGLTGVFGLLLYTPGPECQADFNNDGILNFFDISIFLQSYTAGCP